MWWCRRVATTFSINTTMSFMQASSLARQAPVINIEIDGPGIAVHQELQNIRNHRDDLGGYTVGVLVQTNFGGVLTIGGAPVGIELGSGVKTVGTPRLMTQGTLTQTGNTLDVAIQGQGWIALAMPDGSEAYTRNGSLQLDVNGVLQTRNGIPVQGDGGTITVPPEARISSAAAP